MNELLLRRRVYGGGGSSPVDYSKMYMTIVSQADDNEIKFSNGTQPKLYVSTDDGLSWIEKKSGSTLAFLNEGERMLVKGDFASGNQYGNAFSSTGTIDIEGNVMSLVYGDNFVGKINFKDNTNSTFRRLFLNCVNLHSAKNLILPVTTLTSNCYHSMFQGCTSLIKAPELPATTLAESCYSSMFRNCTALTEAPELLVEVLATSCYSDMFRGDSSLVYIKCLALDVSASNCTINWTGGLPSSGVFVKNAALTTRIWPSTWTVIDYSE